MCANLMQIYDTIVIGSCYRAFGYALTRNNCRILERRELCDTAFFASLSCFNHTPYTPQTPLGQELNNTFTTLGIFNNGMQNVCAFESAFCNFLKDRPFDLWLRTHVLAREQKNGLWHIRTHTDSGIETIAARHIYNTQPKADSKKYLSVLYHAADNCLQAEIAAVFNGAETERAFYPDRYVMYAPLAEGQDLNDSKYAIYEKWNKHIHDAKILRFAVSAGTHGEAGISNPVQAFEKGIKDALNVRNAGMCS